MVAKTGGQACDVESRHADLHGTEQGPSRQIKLFWWGELGQGDRTIAA